MKLRLLFIPLLFLSLLSHAQKEGEVIYHVFQRSFFDSNGDDHGDLKGLADKLDYLQELGVTSILTLPTCESVFYHNYFSGDFLKIDPRYGSMQDWIALVKQVHKRKMKIYLDMEMQYVTEDHPWFKESLGNPNSEYAHFILWKDSTNQEPLPIVFGITQLESYDGTIKKIANVNLLNPQVKDYFFKVFSYWVDPNGDGKFDDGVDGYRLDHMMDDLDNQGKLTHLFDSLWSPLFAELKAINPKLQNVAEQSNWGSYGQEYFASGVDRVFAFRLQGAIASFNKGGLEKTADSTFTFTPEKNGQVVFIENHDMDRFATLVKNDPGKMRVAAALNLLIGGIPSIYYGQELGMQGAGGFGKFGNTDGNDIPRREAFEWFKADSGQGMCLWYKDSGPWWTQTTLKANDGISLEEEKADSNSIWNLYRTLIKLRQSNTALQFGNHEAVANDNQQVYSFLRNDRKQQVLVLINLSAADQKVAMNLSTVPAISQKKKMSVLFGNDSAALSSGKITADLSSYATMVILLK